MEYTLVRQSQINSTGSLVLLGCQWVISVVIVRISGYEDAGVFALAMSISNVFSTFANYGMRNLQLTDKDNTFSPNQYIIARVIASVIAFLACFSYVKCTNDYTITEAKAILLYLIYSLSFITSDIIMGNIQMMNHLEINGISNTARGILCFILFIVAELATKDLLIALFAMIWGSIIILLFYDLQKYRTICKERGPFTIKSISSSLSIFRVGFPVMLTTLIPIVITAIPRREILIQHGEKMLGVFSSIYTPTVVLNTLIPSLLLAYVPITTGYWNNQQFRDLKRLLAKCYGMVILVILVALFLAWALGRPFLRIVYNADILQYAPLLYYAILSIGMNCLSVCGGNTMIAMGNRKLAAIISALSIGITLTLSKEWITHFGIYGAAGIQVATYGFQVVFQLAIIQFCIKKGEKK